MATNDLILMLLKSASKSSPSSCPAPKLPDSVCTNRAAADSSFISAMVESSV
jgi:hypothetical protein